MMPMPPSWAMVMARRASVTVSMAADRMRDVQADTAGEAGRGIHVARHDGGVAGDEKDVVESECLSKDAHEH